MVVQLGELLAREPAVQGRVLAEIIGTTEINAKRPNSAGAKGHIENALASAYMEVLLRRSMDRVFGPVMD